MREGKNLEVVFESVKSSEDERKNRLENAFDILFDEVMQLMNMQKNVTPTSPDENISVRAGL